MLAIVGLGFLAACALVGADAPNDEGKNPAVAIDGGSWRVDWKDGEQPDQEWSTYSVIVVASNPHPSNLFRDRPRVEGHTRGVISVQFADSKPTGPFNASAVGPLSNSFFVSHDERADRRVPIIHAMDLGLLSRWKHDEVRFRVALCTLRKCRA